MKFSHKTLFFFFIYHVINNAHGLEDLGEIVFCFFGNIKHFIYLSVYLYIFRIQNVTMYFYYPTINSILLYKPKPQAVRWPTTALTWMFRWEYSWSLDIARSYSVFLYKYKPLFTPSFFFFASATTSWIELTTVSSVSIITIFKSVYPKGSQGFHILKLLREHKPVRVWDSPKSVPLEPIGYDYLP